MRKRVVSNRKLGPVVASRTLTEDGHRANQVEIVLGMPRRLGTDWECPFTIRGLERGTVQTIAGSDSFQALQLATRALRVRLEETGRRFLWSPCDPAFGSGIAREIPLGLGAASEGRIQRFIEREVKAWSARLEARWRREQRTHGLPPARKTHSAKASSKLRTAKSKKGSTKT
jgi:hypothetical protein